VTSFSWLAFGDGAAWGVALVPSGGSSAHVLLGGGEDAALLEADVESAEGGRRLRGEGLDVTFSGSSGDGAPASAALAWHEHAAGSITVHGSARSLSGPGFRMGVAGSGELDSLRLLAGWFDGDEAVALVALRPRNARGQEGDEVAAALVEAGKRQSVIDPRLSTTYTGEGVPSRAGLELWVSEPGDDPETVTERPHRMAGEAHGAHASWREEGVELGAQAFQWHSHGRDGAGVYVLGRPG
jgi:hypothetical protein